MNWERFLGLGAILENPLYFFNRDFSKNFAQPVLGRFQ
jgi:hypothetical protein